MALLRPLSAAVLGPGDFAALSGLALLDSLNPSALAVTLMVLTQPRARATSAGCS